MLLNFLDNVVGLSGNKQFVSQIKAALEKKKDGQERLRPVNRGQLQPPMLPEGWPMGGRWTMMDVEPVEFARQLTLVALELLQNIAPSELLGAAWTKPNKNVRSPNVMKSIQHFNKVRPSCYSLLCCRSFTFHVIFTRGCQTCSTALSISIRVG